MTVPVFDLGAGATSEPAPRRGLTGPREVPVFDLSGESQPTETIYKDKSDADRDVVAARYRAMFGMEKKEEPPKRGLTGVLSDLGTSLFEGAKSTGRSLGAAGNTITGDLKDVEQYGEAQRAAAVNEPQAKRALMDEIEARKQADKDPGVLSAIRNVGAAMANNPEGAAQFIAEQAPNSVVSLGAGLAGAKALGTAGLAFGPAGAAIGGVTGFLGGMFLGNFMLETGGNAIEKSKGGFTQDERGEALREGAVKGGVITGVDAVTLGAGGKLAKTLNKAALEAGAKAEAKVLADAGVDVTSRAAIERALANPEIRASAKEAGRLAAKEASTVGSKVARAGAAITTETAGEGLGEYLGELAATGKSDVYGAVMEAAAGFTQSAPEAAYTLSKTSGNDLDAKGIQSAKLDPAAPPAPGTQAPPAAPPVDPNAPLPKSELEGMPRMSWMEMNETLQANPGVLAVLQQDAQTDAERDIVNKAIARSEVGDLVQQIAESPERLNAARAQLSSEEYVDFMDDVRSSLEQYATAMPPSGTFKAPTPEQERLNFLNEAQSNEDFQRQQDEEAELIRADAAAQQMSVRKTAAPAQETGGVDVANMTTPDGTVVPLDESNRAGYEAYFAGRGADINGLTNPAVRQSAMQNVMQEMAKVGFTPEESREILNREEPSAPVTGREGTFENLSQTMSREFGEPVENFRQTKAPKYFQRIGNLFGVNIVAYNYTGKNPAIRKKAGRYIAGANGKGTVLLNLTTADNAALFVLGHEVYHDLERRFPQQAQQLALEIKSYLSSTAQQRYKQFYEGRGQAGKTDSEITADVMGVMFTDRKFWEQLGQRNPSLLDRVLSVLNTIIDSFRANAGNSRQQIGKEIAQFEKVRDMMAEFASQGIGQTAQTRGRAQPAAAPAQVSDMDEMPERSKADEIAYQKVIEHLRNGKDFLAVSVWKGQKLGAKGFGKLEDVIQAVKAPQPEVRTPDGKRADERKRYGDYVNREGQLVRNPNAAQVARTDETPISDDQEGMTFTSPAPQPKGKKAKKAPSPNDVRVETAPEELGLPATFEESGGRRLDPAGTKSEPVERELDAPNKFESRPDQQYSIGVGRFSRTGLSDSQMRLRDKLEGLVRQFTRPKFFEDTVLLLQKQIADVDSRLKALNTLEVDGKKFYAKDEADEAPGLWGLYDENSYDRMEKGFRPDKPTTKDELLAARRQLSSELEQVREKSISAKARLFNKARARLLDEIYKAVDIATAGGMKRAKALETASPFLSSLQFDRRGNTQEEILRMRSEQVNAEREAAEEAFDIPEQMGMFDGARVVMGLIYDTARKGPAPVSDNRSAKEQANDAGKIDVKIGSRPELLRLLERGLRDGDFSYDDVDNAFRALRLDLPRIIMDVGGQLAMRKRLKTHLEESGAARFARMEWLVSMDRVLRARPGLRDQFTPGEIAAYEQAFALRSVLKTRRDDVEEQRVGDTVEDAFPAFLFNNYTLDQASKDRELNKWLEGQGRNAWLEDVAYALRARPDLSDQILSKLGEDRAAFDAHIDRIKAARDTDSLIAAKAPAFAELRNMDYLRKIVMDDQSLTNEDRRRILSGEFGPSALINSAPGQAVNDYERVYKTIANSELAELPGIRDTIAKVQALVSGIDPDTGEIFQNREEAEAAAADFVDSVFMNADMTAASRSNLGMKYRPDVGFGMSVEAAGDRDLGLPSQVYDTDQTLEDLQNAGLITEADVESMSNLERFGLDEDSELTDDGNEGAAQDVAADEADSSAGTARIPRALRGGEEYRFRKGFFNGNLVPAVVSEHLNKIASRWAGAPNMVIVPNVQSLPAELLEKVMAKLGSNMFAKGLYYNGDVYIFTDHAESLADAEFTLFHEVQGHFGMRAFLGADFDAYLDRLYKTNPDIRRAADQRMAEDPMGPLEAVDEVLADMQVDGRNQGMFQAYVGKVIAGLRKIGMERVANWIASQGNFEVAYLLRGAKDAVRRGDRPSIGAPDDLRLASTRTPYELFSAKDGKTVAYARYNPVLDRWSIFTATGPDIRQGFNTAIEADFEKVVTTMRKMGRVERRLRSGVYVDNKIPSDLAKIPDFRILSEDINFTSVEGLKNAWKLVKRNGAISLQNEYIPVFEVVNHLERQGKIAEAFDVRGDLEGLYERRTGAKLEKYRKQYEKPLMKLVEQLGKEGGNTTLAEAFPSLAASFKDSRLGNLSLIDAYLGARHAHERNAQIAGINKDRPEKQDGGSGIFNADADLILNTLSRQPYANTLSEMTHILQEMSSIKLDEMYQSGMIGKKELEDRSKYKYYVNLSGINDKIDQFDNPVILAGGPKFGTRKDMRAYGRGDAATNVLVRTLQSFESAVIHAEKNKVKQKVLAMFEINYDPDFVVINKQAMVRKLDENGQVTEATDDKYLQNRDVMVVHVRGKPVTMEFKQKGPGSFAEAINGMIWPPQATDPIQRFAGRANQIMGQMLTTWNPAWVAVNYTRDLQSMYFNAVTEGKITREMAKEMIKLQIPAMKAAFHIATDGKKGATARQDMLDAYNEMRDAGGATSFLNLRSLENQVQELERLMDPKKPGGIKQFAVAAADFMESYTIPVEMAPRIAAFKVMKDNGYSAEEAARFAGDITVNFNMRGSNKLMRNLFLFFNPAVQGANKMYRLAKENPKTFGKIAMGMAVFGFMTNIIARALGGEDDDGIDKLDKVPVFKRATSIVLWPDMPFAAIPIPYGWNAFYAAGNFMADTLWAGSQSASTTAKRIAGTAFESFSPLGGAMLDASSTGVGVLKTVTPTVFSPVVDLILNENRFGAPIAKEASMFGGAKRSDAHMNFDSASPISTAVFRGLNKLTGGDKVESGVIDVNPGAFDYLVSGYMPGLAAETYKLASWATRKALGYDTKEAAIPIVDRLTAKIPEGYNFGMLRRAETFIKTKVDDYEINKGKREDILKEYPNLGTAKSIIAATDYQIGQLRQARNQLEEADMPEDRKVEMYNLSRQREKEIVARSVQLLLQTNPQMRKVLLAND